MARSQSCLYLLTTYLALWSRLAAAQNATCYLPNGDPATGDQPCFPENPESSCCGGSEYICSTNNMCAYFDGSYFVIGSCTDKSWNSPACPGYCFFRDHVHNSVFRCDAEADTYCCADGPSCTCDNNTNTQNIDDFLPPYSVLVGSSVQLNTAVVTSSLFTPSGATRSTTTTSSTTSSTTTTTTDGTTASSTGPPTSSPTTPVDQPTSKKNATKIGLGVGIPLGIIAIGAIIALAVMLRRRSNRNNQVTAVPQVEPPMDYYSPDRYKPNQPVIAEAPANPATHIVEAPGHEAYR